MFSIVFFHGSSYPKKSILVCCVIPLGVACHRKIKCKIIGISKSSVKGKVKSNDTIILSIEMKSFVMVFICVFCCGDSWHLLSERSL